MSRVAQGVLLVVVLAATGIGFAYLYGLRIEKGDIFPAYSSLRSDPLGTRALYDSLGALPGIRVDRRFQVLDDLAAQPPRTIIIAGMAAPQWGSLSTKEFAALDAAVRQGSRLVIALRADFAGDRVDAAPDNEDQDEVRPPPPKEDKATNVDTTPHPGAKSERGKRDLETAGGEAPETSADLKHLWGIDLLKLRRVNYDRGAVLDPAAPHGLPQKLRWKSDSYFAVEKGANWRVVYKALGKPVILETDYGRGSIVVAGDAYLLSNEGLLNDRSPRLLSWLVGPHARVEFDESHLGVIEEVGVAALARRYGLVYAAGTLLLLAALFIWRQTSLFVPIRNDAPEAMLDCSHTAALEALLLRSVPPAGLIEACSAEWRATAPQSTLPRLEAALGPARPGDVPAAYNAAVRALRRR